MAKRLVFSRCTQSSKGNESKVRTGATNRESLTIAGPAGRIEALLEEPKGQLRDVVAVVCHPHPLYHGTMLNKVVHTLARAMNDLGVPAIRFNYRGVGASEGEYGDGLGEADDGLAVVDWARQRYPGARVCLLGFSFGGMVACRAALNTETAYLISVAPAVSRLAGILEGRQPDCPWLVIQGDADEVVSCDEVIEWFNTLAPGPHLEVLPDVSHFFHGRLTVLREAVVSWFNAQWDDS